MDNYVLFLLLGSSTFTMEAVQGQYQAEPRYLLWTRSNPNDAAYYQLNANNANNLQASPFNGKLRTYFIIHGFISDGLDPWVLKIKSNYLTISNCNVISVDWKLLASDPIYFPAVVGTYYVAGITANFIDWLTKCTSLKTSMIHITGHSLGAQVAGMTGKYVTTGKIDRITGLDPAGPYFDAVFSNQRIAGTDAVFVDIIHSNSGLLNEGCFGQFIPLGDVDFYPNGGQFQPGCASTFNISDFSTYVCNHERSHELYAESILAGSDQYPNEFWAWPCSCYIFYIFGCCNSCGPNGCPKMGFNVNRNAVGTFFLTTNSISPFAKGFQQRK